MAHQGPAQPQHRGDRLPKAGAWLNCSPLPALGLHLRGAEFVVACKFRLGLPVYDQPGRCPSCGKDSEILGDSWPALSGKSNYYSTFSKDCGEEYVIYLLQ